MTLLQRIGRISTIWMLSILALQRPAEAEPGDEFHVSVLTFGPHEHPFFKFGHNAILVAQDGQPGWVFNFGTFQFDSIDLLPKFLKGRVIYWLSVAGEAETLESYAAANRTIVKQDLALPAQAKLDLWNALRENAKPQNRGYLYDYFRDNCSTRVRDAIDRATQGAIRRVGSTPGALTYRQHALRMTADFLPEYVGLYLALGRQSDAPISRWEEAFLPEKFQQLIRDVQIPDPSNAARTIPLVQEEKTLFTARRAPHLTAPPSRLPSFFLVGMLLGGVFAALGNAARRSRLARLALGSLLGLLGVLVGFLGTFFVLFWAFTDHVATYANANILQLPAIAVFFTYYGVRVGLGSFPSSRRAYFLAWACVLLSTLGLVAKLLPGLAQDNLSIIAACLPLWVGLLVGMRRFVKGYARSASNSPRENK